MTEPHRLIAYAIEARPKAAHLRTTIICDAGAIAIRATEGSDWTGLQEAVVLPLLAHQDFVISIEAYLALTSDVRPSENPDAEEGVVLYLFQGGEITEVWVLPIHRSDEGRISFGEHRPLTEPTIDAAGAKHLIAMIKLYAEAERNKPPRDRRLEHDLAVVLSGLGHTIVWDQPFHPTS